PEGRAHSNFGVLPLPCGLGVKSHVTVSPGRNASGPCGPRLTSMVRTLVALHTRAWRMASSRCSRVTSSGGAARPAIANAHETKTKAGMTRVCTTADLARRIPAVRLAGPFQYL